jgi:hypothetical protein
MATSSHQIWFWVKPCGGRLRRPVSLAGLLLALPLAMGQAVDSYFTSRRAFSRVRFRVGGHAAYSDGRAWRGR